MASSVIGDSSEIVLQLHGFELGFDGRSVTLSADLRALVLTLSQTPSHPVPYSTLHQAIYGGVHAGGSGKSGPVASPELRTLVNRLRNTLQKDLGIPAPLLLLPRGGRQGYCLMARVVQGAFTQAALPNDGEKPHALSASVVVSPAATRSLQAIPTDGLAEFSAGERMRIEFEASGDAFGYVLDVDTEGEISLLVPSGRWPENQLRAGQRYFIPEVQDNRELPLVGPPGVETVLFLATRQPAPMLGERHATSQVFRLAPLTVSQTELAQIATELTRRPRSEWAVAEFSFVVVDEPATT